MLTNGIFRCQIEGQEWGCITLSFKIPTTNQGGKRLSTMGILFNNRDEKTLNKNNIKKSMQTTVLYEL